MLERCFRLDLSINHEITPTQVTSPAINNLARAAPVARRHSCCFVFNFIVVCYWHFYPNIMWHITGPNYSHTHWLFDRVTRHAFLIISLLHFFAIYLPTPGMWTISATETRPRLPVLSSIRDRDVPRKLIETVSRPILRDRDFVCGQHQKENISQQICHCLCKLNLRV